MFFRAADRVASACTCDPGPRQAIFFSVGLPDRTPIGRQALRPACKDNRAVFKWRAGESAGKNVVPLTEAGGTGESKRIPIAGLGGLRDLKTHGFKMSADIDQIFVRSEDTHRAVNALTTYCQENGFRHVVHGKYQLEGVRETLALLEHHRRKRTFWLLPPKTGWLCLCEVVDSTDFADPEIARFLSDVLVTTALWLTLSEDYNVWAYQHFENGKLKKEVFRPKDYFLGNTTEGDFDSYGLCHDSAKTFNRKWKLPYFLLSMPALKRRAKLRSSLTKLVWRA